MIRSLSSVDSIAILSEISAAGDRLRASVDPIGAIPTEADRLSVRHGSAYDWRSLLAEELA